jgi:hypothetical protein
MKKIFLLFLYLLLPEAFARDGELLSINFHNPKTSSFDWENINLNDFLTLNLNDFVSQGKKHKEIVGKFFQCIGTCHIERGEGFFNPQFRSTIYESDDIQTIGDSYAWIFLLDGTMVRLSPDSSITINELNISASENFLHARINMGSILWKSRLEQNFKNDNLRETDVLFFPLTYFEASPVVAPKIYDENDLIALIERDTTSQLQVERLNELIEDNNEMTREKKTFAFLTLPNVTLLGYNPVVEMVVLLGSKSYFKKQNSNDQGLDVKDGFVEEELNSQLRGYDNKSLTAVDSNEWMEVDAKGSRIEKVQNDYLLNMGSFITKRTHSILVARELLLDEYSSDLFQENYDKKIFETQSGYRLWDKTELDQRLGFMKEYFRRIETTNLFSSAHLSGILKARGLTLSTPEYTSAYFKTAVEKLARFEKYAEDKKESEATAQLNSTTKVFWKRKYGIK